MFGLLNLDKPAGATSRDVVNHVQRVARPFKVGHAGTLDPLATGVLVVCIGAATRLIEYVQRQPKRYRACFRLGCTSPSEDLETPLTLLPAAPRPSRAELLAALPRFVGRIEQRPPQYSALKVAGRAAYKLARRGEAVDLAPRSVEVHRIDVVAYEYPDLELDIRCGSGVYVRSLGRDLAEALGSGAVMSSLVRTEIGGFHLADAVAPRQLDATNLSAQLLPAVRAVPDLPLVTVAPAEASELRHGRPIAARGATLDEHATREWAAVDSAGRLLAILWQRTPGQWWPARTFFDIEK